MKPVYKKVDIWSIVSNQIYTGVTDQIWWEVRDEIETGVWSQIKD